jgi:uncharacterized heparinase superfamily protein
LSITRFYRTARHLKPVQVRNRIARRYTRPRRYKGKAPAVSTPKKLWETRAHVASALMVDGLARFLNESGPLYEWENPDKSKLWLYNLHYFDDLHAAGAAHRSGLHREMIERWLQDNPPCTGTGWEPYPLSRRIVNWIKWLLAGNAPVEGMTASLAQQAHALSRQLEYHLLGNHILANAQALVFAGTYFEGKLADDWLHKGLQLLEEQLPEQVLVDGGHFERSPMYHCLVLMDLLDLIQLGQIYRSSEVARRLGALRETAGGMASWLDGLRHPDGQIPFFNDAAFGITPPPGAILDYAHSLGATPRFVDSAIQQFDASGYISVNSRDQWVVMDVAPVGPDYIPGHAHADTLSFEWSLQRQRVLVNSGTSEYGESAERLRQRGTAAHNTVVVNGLDSSEVWGGFRVARRAMPFDVNIGKAGDCGIVRASHNGYHRLWRKVTHTREWRVMPGELRVTDQLAGKLQNAVAYFHIHPEVKLAGGEHGFELTLPGGRVCRIGINGGSAAIEPSTWHPEFGVSVGSSRLAVTFDKPVLETVFSY